MTMYAEIFCFRHGIRCSLCFTASARCEEIPSMLLRLCNNCQRYVKWHQHLASHRVCSTQTTCQRKVAKKFQLSPSNLSGLAFTRGGQQFYLNRKHPLLLQTSSYSDSLPQEILSSADSSYWKKKPTSSRGMTPAEWK
jgi:hypothetical protein